MSGKKHARELLNQLFSLQMKVVGQAVQGNFLYVEKHSPRIKSLKQEIIDLVPDKVEVPKLDDWYDGVYNSPNVGDEVLIIHKRIPGVLQKTIYHGQNCADFHWIQADKFPYPDFSKYD